MTVRGTTLEEVSRSGPLPPAAVCRIGHKVAAALAAANAANGTLSSRRIVVDDTGGVTLLQAAVGPAPRLLSPERRAGAAASIAADVWTLGVLLADAALGRPAEIGADGRLAEASIPGPSRFVDALNVLVAPLEARLAKPAAAQRVFSELEAKLGGDGDGQLAACVRRHVDSAPRPVTLPPPSDAPTLELPPAPVSAASIEPRTVELGRDGVMQLEELRRVAGIAAEAAGRRAAASVEPPMGMPSSVSSPPPGQVLADVESVEESEPLPSVPRFSRAAMIGIGVVAVVLVFLAFVGGIIASK